MYWFPSSMGVRALGSGSAVLAVCLVAVGCSERGFEFCRTPNPHFTLATPAVGDRILVRFDLREEHQECELTANTFSPPRVELDCDDGPTSYRLGWSYDPPPGIALGGYRQPPDSPPWIEVVDGQVLLREFDVWVLCHEPWPCFRTGDVIHMRIVVDDEVVVDEDVSLEVNAVAEASGGPPDRRRCFETVPVVLGD